MFLDHFKQRRSTLPYGLAELDPVPFSVPGPPKQVRCYVRGCREILKVSDRDERGDVCPLHGIRCFHSTTGATYTYDDVRGNVIVAPDLLAQRVIGNPFKYESHRLGLERSEDALTWNVFRSLQEAGVLHQLAAMVTGDKIGIEPYLYLWGLDATDDEFGGWPLLMEARRRFESNLPVERPLSEPDIAIHLPGRYLILTEAKFTSKNTFYESGPRKAASSLTLDELRGIYYEPSLDILDWGRAAQAKRIYQQLWRNTIFAAWMARADHPGTVPYHVNLVREKQDEESAREFSALITDKHRHQFQRLTWETIYGLCQNNPRLTTLSRYLKNKTAGLKPAFRL